MCCVVHFLSHDVNEKMKLMFLLVNDQIGVFVMRECVVKI